jgi:hypothetical protein
VKRTLTALILVTSSSLLWAGSEPGYRLTVKRGDGQRVALSETKDATAKFWLQQLTLSALYRNVVEDSDEAEWSKAMLSSQSIFCRYPANSKLALPERPLLSFDEILVPLPDQGGPSYVLLKHGAEYKRVAKFDPWVLEKLKIEVGLLARGEPSVPRTLF